MSGINYVHAYPRNATHYPSLFARPCLEKLNSNHRITALWVHYPIMQCAVLPRDIRPVSYTAALLKILPTPLPDNQLWREGEAGDRGSLFLVPATSNYLPIY